MGVRKRRHLLGGVALAAAVAVTGVSPVAADTNLVIGGQAIVANTEGVGVNLRGAVGYDAPILFTVSEATTINVIGGPNTAPDGSVWYNVEVNGTLGWIVSDYLTLPPLAAGQVAIVSGTDGHGLRLREAPSLSAATLTVMPEGAEVSVAGPEQTDDQGMTWAHVSYGGLTGYAARSYLSVGGTGGAVQAVPVSNPAPEAAPSGIVVGGNAEVVNTGGAGLNLRHDVGYGAGIATVAAEGEVVHVIDGPRYDAAGDPWWGVDYKGIRGWMMGAYLAPTDREPTLAPAPALAGSNEQPAASAPASDIGAAIVAEAMKYLGYPYVWGGTTPAGFDCSGFTYYVVNKVLGGGFPRAMESQVVSGTYVDLNDLRPGDIVFQQNTYQWGLSHTGIYIGDGKFIHAADASTGVIISNLWDSYWGSRYYTARRIG